MCHTALASWIRASPNIQRKQVRLFQVSRVISFSCRHHTSLFTLHFFSATRRWWITLLYTLFMLSMAAIEAVSRPALAYRGMLFHVLLAVGVACAAVITLGMAFIVQIKPIYDAPYLIPMLGESAEGYAMCSGRLYSFADAAVDIVVG
jgi:ABC-type iron transport system FetAB permease component